MDQKRVRSIEGGGDDRISALSDDLLCRILSLLPTKDAAATSILSTRWKDLFASVSIIDCSIYANGAAGTASFVPFVYRLLYLIGSRSPHIRKFRMGIHSKALGNLIISSWICTAVAFNIQELILHLDNTNSLKLPLPLFTCKSLTVLDLQGKFLLSVPPNVSLPSLKTLSLTRYVMLYDDDNVRRLLSGCPVLEDLMFNFCYLENIKIFDMPYPSMKRLAIHGHGDYELCLNAPNLERLDIRCYEDIKCSGDAFESLNEVSIYLGLKLPRDVSQAKIPEIVSKACNAPKLFLSGCTVEASLNTFGSYDYSC